MGAGMGADMYVAGDKKSSALLVLGLKLMLPHPTFYLGFERCGYSSLKQKTTAGPCRNRPDCMQL